jgi:DNA-binding response OmpR family regulator
MKKMKILVVDNEMPVAMMVVSLLTRIGFDVQVATKARKGLEIAQERKFDLILLESNLPEISGCEIYAELRQRHISYRTPVIFLCRRGGNECRERALALGADDVIEKPFEADDFISRVLACVEETTPA